MEAKDPTHANDSGDLVALDGFVQGFSIHPEESGDLGSGQDLGFGLRGRHAVIVAAARGLD